MACLMAQPVVFPVALSQLSDNWDKANVPLSHPQNLFQFFEHFPGNRELVHEPG